MSVPKTSEVPTGERWRAVPNWPEYEVSAHGRVRRIAAYRSTYNGRVLRATPNPKGYPSICLSRRNQRRSFMVHTLVAAAFLGPRPVGLVVNHKDGDKTNNHVSNLEYVTYGENLRHAIDTGLWQAARGSRHGDAKLTEADVLEIRRLYANGAASQTQIARAYAVTQGAISLITRGLTWRHV